MQAEANEVAELSGERAIVISRVFDAPRELVWDAWVDPKQVVQWWGPVGFTTTIDVMDVREGGEWIHTMHGPDGTDYPNRSVFTQVRRPELIAYSHGGGKEGAPEANFTSTWTFEDLGDGRTRLTILHEFPTPEARKLIVETYGAIEGGRQTLGRLANLLENNSVAA